jgi:hypothetical protein
MAKLKNEIDFNSDIEKLKWVEIKPKLYQKTKLPASQDLKIKLKSQSKIYIIL